MDDKYVIPKMVLLLAIAVGVGWWAWVGGVDIDDSDPALPTVGAGTLYRHEVVCTCGVREIRHQGHAPLEIQGLDISGLLAHYPDAEGWSVFFDQPNELVVVQKTGEFCAEHAAYRHLGVFDGYVAIYQGPLGGGGELWRVEDIPVDSLPEFYRHQLFKAMQFGEQPPEVQIELRREMEFPDDGALHAALENLDELRQD